jgi:hypothetical protein
LSGRVLKRKGGRPRGYGEISPSSSSVRIEPKERRPPAEAARARRRPGVRIRPGRGGIGGGAHGDLIPRLTLGGGGTRKAGDGEWRGGREELAAGGTPATS